MPRPSSSLVAEIHRLERVDRAARKLLAGIGSEAIRRAGRDRDSQKEWHEIRRRVLAELFESGYEDIDRPAGTDPWPTAIRRMRETGTA
jgi:hypothetical protein